MSEKTPGQVAYEADEQTIGAGAPWAELAPAERERWERIARAVRGDEGGAMVMRADDARGVRVARSPAMTVFEHEGTALVASAIRAVREEHGRAEGWEDIAARRLQIDRPTLDRIMLGGDYRVDAALVARANRLARGDDLRARVEQLEEEVARLRDGRQS